MRGLTPEERNVLVEMDKLNAAWAEWSAQTGMECDGERAESIPVVNDLIEQGRMERHLCRCHGISISTITIAGREALRLYPLMLALQAPARSAP